MHYAIALLNQIISCNNIFGIVILYAFKRTIFTILGLAAALYRHCNLNIRIPHACASQDEIAFKLSNPPNTCRVTFCASIYVNNVLQDRPVIDSVIGVECEIQTKIRKIVLLFTSN